MKGAQKNSVKVHSNPALTVVTLGQGIDTLSQHKKNICVILYQALYVKNTKKRLPGQENSTKVCSDLDLKAVTLGQSHDILSTHKENLCKI